MGDISQLAGRLAIVKEYIPNETRAEHIPGIIEKMQIAKEAYTTGKCRVEELLGGANCRFGQYAD